MFFMPYLFKPWCVFSIDLKKTVFPFKRMHKLKILFSKYNVILSTAGFFFPLNIDCELKKPKYYFTPGLILSFIVYKSCQGILNAYISAEQSIHLFIWYTVAGQFQTQFFRVLLLLIKVLPLTCNTISINAVQNEIWHLPHQQFLYMMLENIPLVSC